MDGVVIGLMIASLGLNLVLGAALVREFLKYRNYRRKSQDLEEH